jgi:hypothetical protein
MTTDRVKMWKPRKTISYNKSGIPKIIHQIWIGEKMPTIISKYTSSFKDMKGYYYKLWKNDDLCEANFPNTWKYIKKMLQRKKIIYAMIGDLMRLEILYHHGGIYVDTTFEAVKSLDYILDNYELIGNSKFIMSNEKNCNLKCRGIDNKLYISNSFIISTPCYIVLERLISKKYLSNIDFAQKANLATGPYYVRTGILYDNEVAILPTDLIYPFNYDDWERFEENCFSYTEKKGFEKYNYFNQEYYIKFPCNIYPDAVMIKNFEVGGTWLKT